jgi:hypothetical protein
MFVFGILHQRNSHVKHGRPTVLSLSGDKESHKSEEGSHRIHMPFFSKLPASPLRQIKIIIVIRMIKLKEIRLAKHVTRRGKTRNAYKILVGKHLGVDVSIILNLITKTGRENEDYIRIIQNRNGGGLSE